MAGKNFRDSVRLAHRVSWVRVRPVGLMRRTRTITASERSRRACLPHGGQEQRFGPDPGRGRRSSGGLDPRISLQPSHAERQDRLGRENAGRLISPIRRRSSLGTRCRSPGLPTASNAPR